MTFKRILFDIETNNLLANMLDYTSMPYKLKNEARLWCIAFFNLDNRKEKITIRLNECTKERLFEIFKNAEEIAGHNIVDFDLPALQLFGLINYTIGYPGQPHILNGKPVKITDTLIWSQLLNPDRFGGHSLANLSKDNFESKSRHEDFSQYSIELEQYMEQDCISNMEVYDQLIEEKGTWNYTKAYDQELKLIDLNLKQSHFGFYFDEELAKKHIVDLDDKLKTIYDHVNPLLPPKPLNKGEKDHYTLPKSQVKKNLDLSANLIKFAEKVGATLDHDKRTITFNNVTYNLPFEDTPLVDKIPATVDDLDHLKGYLLDLGWNPLEWKERDLTKDSKKVKLVGDKLVATVKRYVDSTLNGPYKSYRLKLLEIEDVDTLEEHLLHKCSVSGQVRVPVSPAIRVGTNKELCPNLEKLGEVASFVEDVTKYLTYKHRRNSIAGGKEDEDGEPMTGYLSLIREDGRVPTPAFTMGAASFRYKHSKVANIPRISSIYGHELRSLFGCGKNFIQIGADFASLEARIQGHYVFNYNTGKELAEALVAEKPNDIHCLSADTEILTKKGWKLFSEINTETMIAQWHKHNQSITYTFPQEIICNEEYQGDMVSVEGDRLSILMTPNHRNIVLNTNGEYEEVLAIDLNNESGIIPTHGLLYNNNIYYEHSAPGIYEKFVDFAKANPDLYNKVIKTKSGMVLQSESFTIIEELQTNLVWCNTQALIVQKQIYKKARDKDKIIIYQTIIPAKNPNLKGSDLKHTTIKKVSYTGAVYCVRVSSSFIVCRRNGKIFVTGNSLNAQKLNITRDAAKSFSYATMYGAAPEKLAKMLSVSVKEAELLYEKYWDAVPALKDLKEKIENYWIKTGKKDFLLGIDGRKLRARSKHSLINLLFQSAGAIMCKYSVVYMCQKLEEQNLLGNPFADSVDDPKVFLMIVYHKQNCGFVERSTSKTFLIDWEAKLCYHK